MLTYLQHVMFIVHDHDKMSIIYLMRGAGLDFKVLVQFIGSVFKSH
jgi:hypothetical protein